MPRTARFILPGEPHHVIQRGHNKAQTFFSAKDYELYLGLLEEHASANGCLVHAFVLMTNHVHLLLTPGCKDSISGLMATINQRFVQSVNRRLSRCGSSWQGRFKSSLVDTDSYFLTCQRYIELNPVRARIVPSPQDYPWSSFRHHALDETLGFLTDHEVFLSLGKTGAERRETYAALFATRLPAAQIDRIRIAAAGNRPLGDDFFLERLRIAHGIRVRRERPGPRPQRGKQESLFVDSARDCFA